MSSILHDIMRRTANERCDEQMVHMRDIGVVANIRDNAEISRFFGANGVSDASRHSCGRW
jgi:hypothetical protein